MSRIVRNGSCAAMLAVATISANAATHVHVNVGPPGGVVAPAATADQASCQGPPPGRQRLTMSALRATLPHSTPAWSASVGAVIDDTTNNYALYMSWSGSDRSRTWLLSWDGSEQCPEDGLSDTLKRWLGLG